MKLQRYFYFAAFLMAGFTILYLGKKLLIPFVLAIFIWYLINVLANTYSKIPLGKKRIPKPVSFLASLVSILGALGLLAQVITDNISEVVKLAPLYQQNIQRVIHRIFELLPVSEPPSIRQIIQDINFGAMLSQLGFALTTLVSNAGIVLIYLIFLFLEQKNMKPKFNAMLKERTQRQDIFKIIQRVDSDIQKYIGIKTLTSAITGVFGYVVMTFVGLDFAIFWAILLFVFNFIPTVGSIIATIFPSLLALIQFETFAPFLIIVIGLIIIQVLIGNILDPKLMGNTLNVSPLAILLSLATWGVLWGVIGMILCVPLLAIAMIILSHFEKTRPLAILLSRNGNIRDI